VDTVGNRFIVISLSFAYCKSFRMWLFVQLCSSWQDVKWHIASHGPCAI